MEPVGIYREKMNWVEKRRKAILYFTAIQLA
jgi:hypothetical protein